jgi:hypothetical protein
MPVHPPVRVERRLLKKMGGVEAELLRNLDRGPFHKGRLAGPKAHVKRGEAFRRPTLI